MDKMNDDEERMHFQRHSFEIRDVAGSIEELRISLTLFMDQFAIKYNDLEARLQALENSFKGE